jgi:outer membrane protein assembly factor BamB
MPSITITQRVALWASAGAVLASVGLSAADWPQWRGAARTGISTETGLLRQWPSNGPPLLWRIDTVGGGYSTPAIVGDRLYLVVNEGTDNELVRAFSVGDGKVAWSTRIGRVGNPNQQPAYPGARSTPTIDGDTLYALGSDGDLVALNVTNGSVRWKKQLRADFGGVPGTWAYAESPLVDGEKLVVTPGGKTPIVALNKRTGEVIWRTTPTGSWLTWLLGGEEAGYSSIAVAQSGGVRQYITFLDKGLVSVDANTGAPLWRDDRTAQGSAANIPTPVVGNDIVYHATSQIGGAAVRITGAQGKVTTQPLYAEKRLPGANGGSVLLNLTLYGTNSASLMAIDFATGAVKWQSRGIGTASIAVADGLLFLHGENGDVALVEPSPSAYQERGRFTPPNPPQQRGGARETGPSQAWAHPVVANGRLYIRDLGTMWAYDVRTVR